MNPHIRRLGNAPTVWIGAEVIAARGEKRLIYVVNYDTINTDFAADGLKDDRFLQQTSKTFVARKIGMSDMMEFFADRPLLEEEEAQ